MSSGLSIREWVGVVLLPGITLLGKYIVETRQQRQSGKREQHSEWRGDFDAIRGEWKEIREVWSMRIKAAEDSEANCQERCDQLLVRATEQEERLGKMEGALEIMERQVHQKNEAITILQMEVDMLEKKDRKRNG